MKDLTLFYLPAFNIFNLEKKTLTGFSKSVATRCHLPIPECTKEPNTNRFKRRVYYIMQRLLKVDMILQSITTLWEAKLILPYMSGSVAIHRPWNPTLTSFQTSVLVGLIQDA